MRRESLRSYHAWGSEYGHVQQRPLRQPTTHRPRLPVLLLFMRTHASFVRSCSRRRHERSLSTVHHGGAERRRSWLGGGSNNNHHHDMHVGTTIVVLLYKHNSNEAPNRLLEKKNTGRRTTAMC